MKNDLLKLKEKLQSRLEANEKKLEFYNKNKKKPYQKQDIGLEDIIKVIYQI